MYNHGDLVEAKVVSDNPKLPGVTEFYARWLTADSGQQFLDFYEPLLNRGDWQIVKSYPVASDGSALVEFTRRSNSEVYAEADYTQMTQGGEVVVTVFNNPPLGTPTPSAPAQTPVSFVNAPITAARGLNATLQVKTAPNTSCSIEVDYKSGPSTAAGLGAKTSDAAGNVSWTWKVGGNTTVGSWPITVTCGSGSAQTSINVTLE